MVNLQQVYQILPYPLRDLAASARGYYLRWWRYGRETERLVGDALDREMWSQEQWKMWQEEQLANILHRAATKVPYYRDYWSRKRRAGNRASWEVLENWPVLKKETLRSHNLAFIADDCNIRKLYRDRTSGTSGTPLSIYVRREILQRYFALFETRIRRWNEIRRGERWSILGGQKVVPLGKKKPPYWVFNAGMNQLYLSTYHLSAHSARSYIETLRHFAPTHMIVYPSSAAILASAILEENLRPPRLKAIFSNAELLHSEQREIISRAFQCPVKNTYGMGEMAAAASECAFGTMHVWPEIGKIEVFDEAADVPITGGKAGRFILTGLLNQDMPIIRYEIGDRGELATERDKCACGRNLPLISRIEGRNNDMIITRDGRRVFWLNPVFYGLPVKEAQIIQNAVDRILVRFVPAPEFTPASQRTIIKRLHDICGNVEVTMEPSAQVPRGANGKFRAVISNVTL